jgi:hypothetical protein
MNEKEQPFQKQIPVTRYQVGTTSMRAVTRISIPLVPGRFSYSVPIGYQENADSDWWKCTFGTTQSPIFLLRRGEQKETREQSLEGCFPWIVVPSVKEALLRLMLCGTRLVPRFFFKAVPNHTCLCSGSNYVRLVGIIYSPKKWNPSADAMLPVWNKRILEGV